MGAEKSKAPLIAMAVLAVITALPLIWGIYYFGIFLGYGSWNVRGHQEFAKNGIAQIQPAAEMDKLFEDCRHYIVYSGSESVSTWNATAYFGGRYELTMQVPVEIKSESHGSVIGEPKFYLNEVESVSVSPSGQIGATYSASIHFDYEQWQKVVSSGGDFSEIGFTVKPTAVPDFPKFANAGRQSGE